MDIGLLAGIAIVIVLGVAIFGAVVGGLCLDGEGARRAGVVKK